MRNVLATRLERARSEAAYSVDLFNDAHWRGLSRLQAHDFRGVYQAIQEESAAIEMMMNAITALEQIIEARTLERNVTRVHRPRFPPWRD